MDKALKGITVISLVGSQGSGKSTLGTHLANYLGTVHFETSNIVKASLDFPLDRDELWQTKVFTKGNPNWLGEEIAKRIHKFSGKKTIVLSGTREIQVHRYLRKEGARLHIFHITANLMLRYKRLIDLKKVTSAEHFLNKELRERDLGLGKVVDQAKHTVETVEKIEPKTQAIQIAKTLFEKGIKCN